MRCGEGVGDEESLEDGIRRTMAVRRRLGTCVRSSSREGVWGA